MHLSGQLSDWSISDLLQIMQVTEKTGSLDIDAERRGRIHFREGLVTGAELTDTKKGHTGNDRVDVVDTLYVLSTLSEGSFTVGPADGSEGSGWSVEDVIADVDVLKELEHEISETGLFEAPGVRLVQSIDEPMTIFPEDWSVLVSLVQPFTFSQLEARLGRGGAIRVLHSVQRLGVAEPTNGDDEADWLERLADVITPESAGPTWVEEAHGEEPKSEETQAEPESATAGPEPDVTKPEPDVTKPEPDVSKPEPKDQTPEPEDPTPKPKVRETVGVPGVAAQASTMLTDGLYDEIRRLRSKIAEK